MPVVTKYMIFHHTQQILIIIFLFLCLKKTLKESLVDTGNLSFYSVRRFITFMFGHGQTVKATRYDGETQNQWKMKLFSFISVRAHLDLRYAYAPRAGPSTVTNDAVWQQNSSPCWYMLEGFDRIMASTPLRVIMCIWIFYLSYISNQIIDMRVIRVLPSSSYFCDKQHIQKIK